ncbi:hypothetical protein CW749_09640 [Vibrio sp. vnigr-6D03]|nr:hypothetical protein CW749_09640 [Vibrio sp. vnigr-6D03]
MFAYFSGYRLFYLLYTQVTSRCRIQSLIFCFNSRKITQWNDESFPSYLTMKWDRILAPKGEFNWFSCHVTDI